MPPGCGPVSYTHLDVYKRQASAFLPLPGVDIDEMMQAACLASSGDETPEGRSIVELGNTLGVSLNGVPQDVVSVPRCV